jgi:hypothetical protein
MHSHRLDLAVLIQQGIQEMLFCRPFKPIECRPRAATHVEQNLALLE